MTETVHIGTKATMLDKASALTPGFGYTGKVSMMIKFHNVPHAIFEPSRNKGIYTLPGQTIKTEDLI